MYAYMNIRIYAYVYMHICICVYDMVQTQTFGTLLCVWIDGLTRRAQSQASGFSSAFTTAPSRSS